MEEIHVSRLGFHVTSWTNLRKAPIIVDIGQITAKIEEPLTILPPDQRRRLEIITERELNRRLAQGFKPLRGTGSYGLVDRIVDNLTIEIESFRLEFQTWGKFKTKRVGPWTPPLLRMDLKHLKICSVDSEGSEGNPDQVWAHNQGRKDSFLMYKKMTGECKIQVVPQYQKPNQNELSNLNMEVQIAIERRLQDGAFLACQFDVTIPELDFDIKTTDTRPLAHLASGLQYCFTKDRSFEDPLKALSESHTASSASSGPSVVDLTEVVTNQNDEFDAPSRASSFDGNSSQGSFASSESYGGKSQDEDLSVTNDSTHVSTSKSTARDRSKTERSVILLPNDLVIYRSISVTCSVHKLVVWASYPGDNEEACLEFAAKGCVAEAIWPKIDGAHGLYIQLSTSFVSLEERIGHHQRVLLLAGMHRDDHLSMNLPSRKPQEIGVDEFFPLFERRSIREDPLDLRHLCPTQAFGLKTTIDEVHDSNDDDDNNHFMVVHEFGGDEIEIVLDTDVILRIAQFIMNADGEGLDPRWDTGDWTDLLTPDMFRNPSDTLYLEDYIQESPQLFLDENLMISSELFKVIARFTNVVVRVPSAVQDSLRSCDIQLKWKEATFVVSSDLPRTFLTGRIGNSIGGEDQNDSQKGMIEFPNDPSDICYSYEKGFTGKHSKFRFQLTPRGFEVNIIPAIAFCTAPEPKTLLSICESTMVFSLESEPPKDDSNRINITIFLSVLIQELIMNIDFDLLAGATCTLLSHKKKIDSLIEMMNGAFSKSQEAETTSSKVSTPQEMDENRIEKSLKGRRMLTRRQVMKSRETGGLAIIFCFQQKHCKVKVWRQNVPLRSPLRDNFRSSRDVKYQDDGGLMEVLNILDFEMEDLELGLEFDSHFDAGYRTVLKSHLRHANLRLIDLAKEIEEHKSGPNGSKITKRFLSDLCTFGSESIPEGLDLSGSRQQFAFRLEANHKNNAQSWSMAIDASAPSKINLNIGALKDAVILLIEAFLLPAWANSMIETSEGFLFPQGTIGAMLFSVAGEYLGHQTFTVQHTERLEVNSNSGDPMLELFLRSMCKTFLPRNLQVILLRCEISNMLISTPSESIDGTNGNDNVSIFLEQSDLVTRFYPLSGSPEAEYEQVLACNGMDWSTLINTNEEGLYCRIFSRQSMLTAFKDDGKAKLEPLLRPFEMSFTYAGAGIDFSLGQGIAMDDVRRIEKILGRLKSVVALSTESISDLYVVMEALDYREPSANEGGKERKECSFSEARSLLQKANIEFSLHENSARDTMRQKNTELETLKIDLIKKERERFGSLSLMSSRVAGWIRMASQHRSGQRVMKKSLLWPYWGILRKELLILFPRPGEPQPSDIISLVNARLQKLAGGNSKQDTKRGFAIVETSGMERYFVTANAQEYEIWTKEIDFAIRLFSDPLALSSSEDYNDMETSDLGVDDEETNQRSSMIGNRLSSAFQSTRFRAKQDADRTNLSQTLYEQILEDQPSVISNEIQRSSELTTIEPVEESLTLGKKFSEVGLATKSRLGSAIQNASRRLVDSSAEDTDPTQESVGPRPSLQLGNKLGSAFQSARMKAKGSIERQGLFRGNDQQADPSQTYKRKSPVPPQGGSSSHDSANSAVEPPRTANRSPQPNARSNDLTRSSRFGFLRRNEDMQNDAVFGGEAITLKSIYAGEDIKSIGGGSQLQVPLRMLKERWYVRVHEITKPSSASQNIDSIVENLDGNLTDSSVLMTSLEAKEEKSTDSPSSSNGNQDIPQFLLTILKVQHTEAAVSVEKQWSFGDAVRFYSVISEAIEDTLKYQHGKVSSIWDESSASQITTSSTLSSFEKVMVCGRVLGGILETRTSFDFAEGFRRYQSESIENFLNCLLECPLPSDALVLLSGTLGINESIDDFVPYVMDDASEGNPLALPVDGNTADINRFQEDMAGRKELDLSATNDRSGSILKLLSACEAELHQIESKKTSMEQRKSDEIPSSTEIQSVLYEPLLPPTLTEKIHHSMKKSLSDAMAQRDEAHAQLIGANVMHSNSLERMRRKNERLEIDATLSRELARMNTKQDLEVPDIAKIFMKPDEKLKIMEMEIDEKIEKVYNAIRNDNDDAEMTQLSSQLATEIATKTSLTLEIERMKETREIENKTQLAEKQALQDEMKSLRELLELERQKNAKANAEAAHWKALFEERQVNTDDGA